MNEFLGIVSTAAPPALLFLLGLMLVADLIYTRSERRSREKFVATARSRGAAGSGARTSARVLTRSDVEREEFTSTMRIGPGQYLVRSLAYAFAAAAIIMFFAGSWGFAAYALVGIPFFRDGTAHNRIQRAREESFSNEMLPLAQQIQDNLATQIPFSAALASLSKMQEDTPMIRAIRRAVSSPGGLAEGLRFEMNRFKGGVAREYWEILAEGVSMDPNLVQKTLAAFIDMSQRRRDAWREAVRGAIEARDDRKMIMVLGPGMLVLNVVFSGGYALLHTTPGNILVLAEGALLVLAMISTEYLVLRKFNSQF